MQDANPFYGQQICDDSGRVFVIRIYDESFETKPFCTLEFLPRVGDGHRAVFFATQRAEIVPWPTVFFRWAGFMSSPAGGYPRECSGKATSVELFGVHMLNRPIGQCSDAFRKSPLCGPSVSSTRMCFERSNKKDGRGFRFDQSNQAAHQSTTGQSPLASEHLLGQANTNRSQQQQLPQVWSRLERGYMSQDAGQPNLRHARC